MSHSDTVSSEVAYYAGVTVDVFKQLDSLFQQLNHLNASKQFEEERNIEEKASRVIHERLPKLLHQVWHELCVSIESFISFSSTCNGRTEEWTQELVYYCTQLAFLRSVHCFIIATLSTRVQKHNESILDSGNWPRCIAHLLQERESPRSAATQSPHYPQQERQQSQRQQEEWLMDFVKKLLHVTVQCTTNNTVFCFSPLEETLAVAKEIRRGSSAQLSGRQRAPEGFCDENIYQEHLTFFTAACLGVAEELLAFLRDTVWKKDSGGEKQGGQMKCQRDSDRSILAAATHQLNAEATTTVSFTEAADTKNDRVGIHDCLTAGEERWIFFRTHPGDKPSLTVSEVAAQVRSFYETYNKKKNVLAERLAEGFGEDYVDLFDALEYRYCFAPQDGSQDAANSPIHDAIKDDWNDRRLGESNQEDLGGNAESAGCAVM